MTLNGQGAYTLDGTPLDKLIHTVIPCDPATGQELVGKAYLLGRKDTEAVTLNLDEQGNLHFRPAWNGLVPIGSVAEIQMINGDAPANPGTYPYLDGKYALEADLDLLGGANTATALKQSWTPIGGVISGIPYYFSGVFDGNRYRLNNLYVNDPGSYSVGLFSFVSGRVRNVMAAGEVTGGRNAGGVAGKA